MPIDFLREKKPTKYVSHVIKMDKWETLKYSIL